VSKPEWGIKRICQSCAAHFYDMRKSPIICPKCGSVFDPEAVLKSRRRAVEKLAPVKAAPEDEIDLSAVEAEADIEAAEEDAVIEDTSELGEDSEDVSEVIEGVEEDES